MLDRPLARIDEPGAEPAAAIAAEGPGGPLVPEGPCSATPPRRLGHDNTAVLARRRVMRHFLPAALTFKGLAETAFAIALLAPRVLETPPVAVLIEPPGTAHRVPARRLTTAR